MGAWHGLQPEPVAWAAVCALGAAGSAAGFAFPAARLDWQPALAAIEPWRLLTAAWVHWSPQHLAANLAGAAVLAAFGWAARLPRRATVAWALAWPLTHAALLLQPSLLHYGGLSGVLHAGVAVGAVFLIIERTGRARAIGIAVGAGLVCKVLLERPWDGPLAQPAGWDIAVAPLAHAVGALAGVGCALLCLLRGRRRRPRSAGSGE